MITYVNPAGSMELLSQLEVDQLKQAASGATYQLFRNCSLAVLNCGSHTDSSKEILEKNRSFDINVIRRERGVKLELFNPPASAFVDGELIRGIQEHLFSVLRDILYVSNRMDADSTLNLTSSVHVTNWIFSILRNARVIRSGEEPNLVVCWGGHSINPTEYQYTREVGSELGLRELNICTGCGPGAMEGPMKGAAVGHSKQRYHQGRFLGLTEPSIIAAEPPNPIVTELVIMPDIEKRLEAFVRLGHGIIIFPGGVGTAEELLYILGIRMHPANAHQPMPLILTGPKESADYFETLDHFIRQTLGEEATRHYQIIIDNAVAVAQTMKQAMPKVREHRKATGDAYSFNWSLKIEPEFQLPFEPDHDSMAGLNLHWEQPPEQLAANLRRAFSGIVAGNVKEGGLRAIERHGPFQLHGDKALMKLIDKLLKNFVAQGRMKLPGSEYIPCYEIIR
ncbi:nucleotide 5'-monophosphate nucleosidase PpnN [Pseudaeromonas sharmana]|uniref:AMP nucleosidase n=1 Tax=Pseudaeromonas sharmana TaxID=328412 RepID=A0ABV8CRP5_9GAMM